MTEGERERELSFLATPVILTTCYHAEDTTLVIQPVMRMKIVTTAVVVDAEQPLHVHVPTATEATTTNKAKRMVSGVGIMIRNAALSTCLASFLFTKSQRYTPAPSKKLPQGDCCWIHADPFPYRSHPRHTTRIHIYTIVCLTSYSCIRIT